MVAKVLSGERPERPTDPGLTNKLWALTKRCLERNPRRRPGIAGAVGDLQKALVSRRRDYVDIADNVRIEDATFGSTLQQGLLYRASSYFTPPEVAPTVFQGTSIFARRFLGRRTPNRPLPEAASDTASSIGSSGSGDNLHLISAGGSGTRVVGQFTPSRSRDFLRRTGSWFMSLGGPSAQDQHNRPDDSWGKRGTPVTWGCFFHSTTFIPPGGFAKLKDGPPAPSRSDNSVGSKHVPT